MANNVKTTFGTVPGNSTPWGYVQMTGLSAAASLTSIPEQANYAILIAETQSIRWRDDTTAPTATVGMLLPVNTPLTYAGDLTALQVIETTTGAVLNVSYYRSGT